MTRQEHKAAKQYRTYAEQQWERFIEQLRVLLPNIARPEDIPLKDLPALLRERYPDGLSGAPRIWGGPPRRAS